MKSRYFFLTIIFILFICECGAQTKVVSKSDNLIELTAVRQSNPVNASNGYLGMMKKDGRFWDNVHPKVTGIPEDWDNVKLYFFWISNVQALYQGYKAGVVPKKDFEYYINAWGSDTTICTPKNVKTYVVIAAGTAKNGKRYALFDSNNNYDLADETPTELPESNMNSMGSPYRSFQSHKIMYEKFVDNKIQRDSTWIAFYERNERMWLQFCEHTAASFQLGSVNYQIKAVPAIVSAEYRNGTTFEITANDNLIQRLEVGELLKLNDSYFRMDCTINGLKIKLTKVLKFDGSTQIGMAPIPFSSMSLKGDSIHFPSDFKGKYVLLDFWSTGCGPCVQEMRDYYVNIYRKYGGSQFEIIGVADNLSSQLTDFILKNNIKWTIIPDGKSKHVLKKYKIFQYPTLFLINPEGIIISKGVELRSGKFEPVLEKNIKANVTASTK